MDRQCNAWQVQMFLGASIHFQKPRNSFSYSKCLIQVFMAAKKSLVSRYDIYVYLHLVY